MHFAVVFCNLLLCALYMQNKNSIGKKPILRSKTDLLENHLYGVCVCAHARFYIWACLIIFITKQNTLSCILMSDIHDSNPSFYFV